MTLPISFRLRGLPRVALMLGGMTCLAPVDSDAQEKTSSVITRAEIDAQPQLEDALEIVRKLRPIFLRARGNVSVRGNNRLEPDVYVDDIRMLSIDALTTIPSSNVEEIRYLSPVEAGPKYGKVSGGGAAQGVILVRTRRQAGRPPAA